VDGIGPKRRQKIEDAWAEQTDLSKTGVASRSGSQV